MKTVFLLRHAKSSWDDPNLEDFDRPLNKRGRRSAKAIADYMRQQKLRPDQVLCSAAKRTRETVERLQRHLGRAFPVRYERGLYMADAAVLLSRVRRLPDETASVMLIAHNPGLEHLLRMLQSRDEDETAGGFEEGNAGSTQPDAYPTGAMAVLALDVDRWQDIRPGNARLIAFVRPRDLLGSQVLAE